MPLDPFAPPVAPALGLPNAHGSTKPSVRPSTSGTCSESLPEHLMESPELAPPSRALLESFDWRVAVAVWWQALGHKVIGPRPLHESTLSAIRHECALMVVIVAWVEADFNITHAAARLGTSRRVFRNYLHYWRSRRSEIMSPIFDRLESRVPRHRSPRPTKPGEAVPEALVAVGDVTLEEPADGEP